MIKTTSSKVRLGAILGVLAIGVGAAGCGGSSSSSTSTSAPLAPPSTSGASTGSADCGSGAGAPTATSEAQSTAQGDIPDNQNFLQFKNSAGGYTIDYPEGWAQSGNGDHVTFRQQGNSITIDVKLGSRPTPDSVRAELDQLAQSDPCLKPGTPQAVTAGQNQAIKVTYTTLGAKNPVTGKSSTVSIDRYVYFKSGKVATVDLATPVGVDNVDAYRMISESFRWL